MDSTRRLRDGRAAAVPGGGDAGPDVGFREALGFWAKLGFVSFGGPAGQIAIMHRELVDRRRWISEERFLHALNYCMLLPGPEAQQLATYIGWLLHGTRGGVVAGVLFVLPSAVLLFGLSYVYAAYGQLPAAGGVLHGFKAVVVAIVAEAVLRMGRRTLGSPGHVLLAAAAFLGIHLAGIPFPLIVLGAAAAGLAITSLRPPTPNPTATAGRPIASELHRFHGESRGGRTLRVAAVGLGLWMAPGIALWTFLGGDSLPVRQYAFFTGAALVTFGGAYAVLAYVIQAAVHAYGWITPAQAVDGLALAETTPGPLIMVLQFVGFLTGWNQPGDLDRLTAATIGAAVTTWVTFLPSFVFVLAGAPSIEALRGHEGLTRALSGVTASVLGVVASLALTFGEAVIFPRGLTGGVDLWAVAMAVAAFAALHRWRVGAVWVVPAGGLAGLIRAFVS